MDSLTLLVGYLALHRVLLFVAGMTSIVLGYKLLAGFTVAPGDRAGRTEVNMKWGGALLSAKGVAPGALFALFGAVLLSLAAAYKPPELTIELIKEVSNITRVQMRGVETERRAEMRIEPKTSAEALEIAQELAPGLNNIAWTLAPGKETLATALVRASIEANPRRADAHHTLATILKRQGDTEGALRVLRRASELDKAYEPELNHWQNDVRSR